MAQPISDNYQNNSNKPLDNKFGPYATPDAALAAIPIPYRHKGLTVGIIINKKVVDYFWEEGTANSNLVQKLNSSPPPPPAPEGAFFTILPAAPTIYDLYIEESDAQVSVDDVLHDIASEVIQFGVTGVSKKRIDAVIVNLTTFVYELIEGEEVDVVDAAVSPTIPNNTLFVRYITVSDGVATPTSPIYVQTVETDGKKHSADTNGNVVLPSNLDDTTISNKTGYSSTKIESRINNHSHNDATITNSGFLNTQSVKKLNALRFAHTSKGFYTVAPVWTVNTFGLSFSVGGTLDVDGVTRVLAGGIVTLPEAVPASGIRIAVVGGFIGGSWRAGLFNIDSGNQVFDNSTYVVYGYYLHNGTTVVPIDITEDRVFKAASVLTFLRPITHLGTYAIPITGNITANVIQGLVGNMVFMIHEDGVEPTFPAECNRIDSSGEYVVGGKNRIIFHLVSLSPLVIDYAIR